MATSTAGYSAHSFAALIAQSQQQTEQQQALLKKQREEKEKREEERKRKQQEREEAERKREIELRKKRLEEEERERQRQRKKEEEERALEAKRQKKAEEQKNKLLYGKPSTSRASGSRASSTPARRRPTDDDEMEVDPSKVLTREEKREKKLQAQLAREFNAGRRIHNGVYHKPGRRLPGGAVDMATPSVPASGSTGKSFKAQLISMPITLTKLNTVKRDTRTIDEILRERAAAKAKALDGDEAREFTDWFGSSKKGPSKSEPVSGANTPTYKSTSSPAAASSRNSASSSTARRLTPPTTKNSSSSSKPPVKSALSKPIPRVTASDRVPSSKPSASKSSSSQRPLGRTADSSKKRQRSSSRSESPYPSRKRARSEELDDDDDDLDPSKVSQMIWGIMGKRKSDYTSRDIFSDDDESDMEAGASDLEREEKRSSRIAKKEDELALEEEKRREDEKKRRKRGY
ncbi:hypothetical protein VNI00_007798 [Paramarasmius palmivorus]|uniref:SPT2 chromatin protein n=1 Tax=Paramarasmius palmivorus TaxID=297713 RepID=A0AAW0CV97_9AGAR